MKKFIESIFGKKIQKTRVVPVATKIIVIFAIFILISNLSSNYINLIFNRTQLINLMQRLLAKDLKDMYSFANNQYEIYQFNENLEESVSGIEQKAIREFDKKRKKSIALGLKPDGTFLFQASKMEKVEEFPDKEVLASLVNKKKESIFEGFVSFIFNNEEYFGFYKYNEKWQVFLIRAEEFNEFYKKSRGIFIKLSVIIIFITILSVILGVFILGYLLRYIKIMTTEIMEMVGNQQLRLLDLKHAPNDNITYLGVAFNSLSSTIDNLVGIFRKFVNRDVADRAYKERIIRLEGSERELTILFTDIKSFTFITETLGSDIIKLLNLHYNRAIHEIMNYQGIIGSIIGDALLAVYGALDDSNDNKSYQAVLSAYKIQNVAKSLRIEMYKKKEELKKQKGALTRMERKIYKAVLLEVGVGLDGGNVFYGNIGSTERMTNTVIGDNVNSSSRLEGLTRIYQIPIICSEFVKKDIEGNVDNPGIQFLEIDTVQVKGKTTGKKVYWPILEENINKGMKKDMENFSEALKLYYKGSWKKANSLFRDSSLPLAEIFAERTQSFKTPENWNGIWEMKTK